MVTIELLDEFRRQLKHLHKKYKSSIINDYSLVDESEEDISVTLLSIYDKSEISSVSNEYIQSLLNQILK